VQSTVTLDAVDGVPTITTSRLTVSAKVAGLDADAFAAVVDEAAALCPVSRLFAGAKISVDAELD
jgi:osmotically inducible protein OsmC